MGAAGSVVHVVIGGGAATITRAFGGFGSELPGIEAAWIGPPAAAAIIANTGIKAVGLRAAAGTQNTLTCCKIAALLVIVAVGLTYGSVSLARSAPQGEDA